MKKTIVLILMFFPLLLVGKNTYKEGDIIFQISDSRQSNMIQMATMSPWPHCGIIVEKGKELYVLEASNVVKLTPLQQWIAKGRCGGLHKVRRVFDKPVKVSYKKYLDKKYDLAFKMGNGKFYCSELVWIIYKEQFGTELCMPKRIREYHISLFKDQIKKRGIDINGYAVAPCDLL